METLLIFLPFFLSFWNGILLSWGTYLIFSYVPILSQLYSIKHPSRRCNLITFVMLLILSAIICGFLFIAPQIVVDFGGDAIIVLDVWYTGCLVLITREVYKWQQQQPILARFR